MTSPKDAAGDKVNAGDSEGQVALTGPQLALLALAPIVVGVILTLLHPAIRSDSKAIRMMWLALNLIVAASLGFISFHGVEGARRLLPGEGAEPPIQLMGVISLLYAATSAVVMTFVLFVAIRDALSVLRSD